ncbi:hypothetical protein Tco_0559900 [Tanacetum coccineum]
MYEKVVRIPLEGDDDYSGAPVLFVKKRSRVHFEVRVGITEEGKLSAKVRSVRRKELGSTYDPSEIRLCFDWADLGLLQVRRQGREQQRKCFCVTWTNNGTRADDVFVSRNDDGTVELDEAHASKLSISSIWCAPFEALYGRKCRSPVLWAEIGESSLTRPELVQEMTDKVVLIKEKLKAARDRQKSCADNRRKPLEFEVGERVMLKVSPWKGVIRFGKKGKLAPRIVVVKFHLARSEVLKIQELYHNLVSSRSVRKDDRIVIDLVRNGNKNPFEDLGVAGEGCAGSLNAPRSVVRVPSLNCGFLLYLETHNICISHIVSECNALESLYCVVMLNQNPGIPSEVSVRFNWVRLPNPSESLTNTLSDNNFLSEIAAVVRTFCHCEKDGSRT